MFCGIDVRGDFRAVAGVTVSGGVARVVTARTSLDEKIGDMLATLPIRQGVRYASVLHANSYDTLVYKIPTSVRPEHELSIAEHKVHDLAHPPAPRTTLARRSAPNLLSIHVADQKAIADREAHAPNAIVIDAASAWSELAPDALIDMGHDGLNGAIYVQTRSTAPFVKQLAPMATKELAALVISHLGTARSNHDARAQSILYSGCDLDLYKALLPHCKLLGFKLNLVTIDQHVNPPWALAAASAIAAARITR